MTETSDKTTHAQRRRRESQDASRLKLRTGQYIRRLHEIAENADKLAPEHVPAQRLKADVYFRLLAKCLPDLKAIELAGTVDGKIEVHVVRYSTPE